ncbi:MAG: hypothetical protein PHW83_00840 [Bacteroidales bacterium]|nr:hypothetical protein [Bacteroidales bacterium]
MTAKIKIAVTLLLIFINLSISAQFYNGHQMDFGKNRVQFDNYEWFYFRFQQFDVYFYAGSRDIALTTATIANNQLSETENFFEHQLKQRIVFVVYQNLSDFRQSNIGLNTGDDQYNIGGVTKVIDNIAFLFVEGDLISFQQQVQSAIANVFLNEMLYGSEISTKVANNTLINMPNWYIDGMLKFVSEEWNSESDNLTRNALNAGKFDNFNQLNGEDAAIVGHAIWNYIAKTYGKQVIPNIVYLTRVTKNPESGFLYVLGISMSMLQQNMTDFYKAQYDTFALTADDPSGVNTLRKSKKETKYYQVQYNSNADKIAWTENILGKYRVKVKDIQTGKTTVIFKREHKLEQITDYSYPVLKWHPSGILLGFIIEKKGEIYYTTYNFETKEYKEIELTALEKVNSFDYSHDGMNLVIAGFNNGQSDIFIFNILANTLVNITQDNADDYTPSFVNKSQQIIFSSKRKENVLGDKRNNIVETQKFNDVFKYDMNTKRIEQITNSDDIHEEFPDYKNKTYTFISDENGIKNIYSAQIDSAISFIDTTTHYRFFQNKRQLTNYKNNILEYSADKFSDANTILYYSDSKYKILFNNDLPASVQGTDKTTFRKNLEKENNRKKEIDIKQNKLIIADSLANIQIEPSEYLVNINNYDFEPELIKTATADRIEFDEKGNAKEPRMGKYQTTFYTNYVVSQIDFGFLSSSYQAFTGSAFYFNPGFNMIFKVGTQDLFEDYRITAGFRFSGNFDSNEYLLSFENLKKRWNKQVILHRQVINNYINGFYIKTFTHESFYKMRYPFSQVGAFQVTANLRQNMNSFLSVDYQSLIADNIYDYWGGIKAEYIFDNTKQICTNILSGARFKVFGEFYKRLDKKDTDLFVTGADFRYYQPIHRNFIFAARFATSASFGSAKLIYYLGGMDNWINLSSKVETFNYDIRIDPEINYVYQAVATNLRGFSQNIRNGTNFAVINAELRLPVISYFYRRPINSDFLHSLQVIAFFDIGSAWSGLNPFDGNNAYENDYYDNYPVTVIIHNDNFPIVSGYGFGLRSRIFGYFIRADWAWGIDNNYIQPSMFYISLSTDF